MATSGSEQSLRPNHMTPFGRQPRFPAVADSRRWKAGLFPRMAANGRRRELTLSANCSHSAPRSIADLGWQQEKSPSLFGGG